jgi:Holliday junction resolvase
MSTHPIIEKASGEKQPFDPEKLRSSLQRSGTDASLIDEITEKVTQQLKPGTTTREIYSQAFQMLRQHKRYNAARYSLKKAMMELGPTGFPFEHFVGQVLAHHGFDVLVGQVLQGKCVTHEIDVVATHNHTQYLVECKFYNSQGKYASVQVPLYVRSRVNDIIEFREKFPEYKETRFFGWVVTNTRFTEDALNYGRCAGLHMLSWDFPEEKSLKSMVESLKLFPITVLTNLSAKQKQQILSTGIVLCRQLFREPQVLEEIGLSAGKKNAILKELKTLVSE